MKKLFLLILITVLSALIIWGGWFLFMKLTSVNITVKFKELRPLPRHVEVLYKGIKIGHAVSAKHTDDFEHTLVKLELRPKHLALPNNMRGING